MMPKSNQINIPILPEGYSTHFSQVNAHWSIWHTEKGSNKPEMMAEGFKTKEEAIEFLLFP